MNAIIEAARGRRRPAAGVVVAACCGALALCGLLLIVATDWRAALEGHAVEDCVTALLWAWLAGLLAARAPQARVLPLLYAVSVAATIAVVASAWAVQAARSGWPGVVAGSWWSSWVWVISTLLPITLVPLWFPDGPSGRASRWMGNVALGGIALTILGLATSATIELTKVQSVPNPLAWAGSDALFLGGSAITVPAGVASWLLLARRLAHSSGERRRQIAPVLVATAIEIPVLLGAAAWPVWGPVVQLATAPLLPAAIAIAVLRFRLYDVEVVVRRSVLLVGLTALVVGGYVVVVQAATILLHRQAGLPESVVATAAVALAFEPARARLQRGVGRWLYGDRAAPHRALASVSEQLVAAADPRAALGSAADRLRASLRLPWVAVRTPDAELATSGTRPAWASSDTSLQHIRLVHLGVDYGSLAVASRSARDRLSAADRALLEQLAVPVAAVVAAGRLIDDLRRSREEVVLARAEERRRIRHDLHDGIGPTLSAIVTHVDVASLRLQRDPLAVPAVLERIASLSSDAVDGLRRVVEGLAPSGVDDLGLAAAVEELAQRFTAPEHARVRVRGAALPDLPAAVEVAAYLIVAESLNNAIVHGRAAHVLIDLAVLGEELIVAITDDGTGFSAETSTGVGLHSMTERAAELGGRLTLASGRGGTKVLATVPLHHGGTVPLHHGATVPLHHGATVPLHHGARP